MRKALLLLIIALIPALYGVAPVSRKIGPVIVSIESGSISETALAAVSEPFTEEWLERYTSDPMAAGEVLSPVLSSVLPIANPIAGNEKAGAVDILDLATGRYEPSGLLPFQMPADMETVEAQAEDTPRDMRCHTDSDGHTYDFAYGMNWSGVIKDERTERYN